MSTPLALRIAWHLQVSGTPCQPYTSARNGTCSSIPAWLHPLFSCTFGVNGCATGSLVEAFELLDPIIGVSENVPGMLSKIPANFPDAQWIGQSWLEYLEQMVMGLHGRIRFRCETTEMDITHQMKQLARPRVYMITLNIARLRPVSSNTTHHDQVFHLAEQIIDSYKLRAPVATMDFLKQFPLVHDLAFDGAAMRSKFYNATMHF